MPESRVDNTEEVLKRLLVNIEAFKRLERDNQKLQAMLIENEANKKNSYKRKVELESIEAGKRELATKKIAREVIEKFRKANEVLIKELAIVQRKNSFLSKKYMELSRFAKRLDYDNRNMKAVLMKSNAEREKMGQKMLVVTEKLEEKHALTKLAHTSLIREYELFKLERDQKLLVEKKKSEFLANRYAGLAEAFGKAKDEFNRTRKINEALVAKINVLLNKSLANEKILEARTELIKIFFEKKLKEMAKGQIDKEIDYKARIESMSRDLAKYYEELKDSKQKYYSREKEIREKIKDLLN